MTNYEWLIKYNEELVKSILAIHVCKEKGIPGRCSKTKCDNCDFNSECSYSVSCCTDATKKWLEEEHVPLYKKGDLVVDSNDQLAVVVKEEFFDSGCDEAMVMISHYVDNTIGIKEHVTEIKKKVGHI